MQNIFVIGSVGFIESNLVLRLLEKPVKAEMLPQDYNFVVCKQLVPMQRSDVPI